jgi:hypothetical protein
MRGLHAEGGDTIGRPGPGRHGDGPLAHPRQARACRSACQGFLAIVVALLIVLTARDTHDGRAPADLPEDGSERPSKTCGGPDLAIIRLRRVLGEPVLYSIPTRSRFSSKKAALATCAPLFRDGVFVVPMT